MNPRLIIRAVQLDIDTTEGRAGVTVPFQRGLNILRADNSSGKSTCLQAIIYGLGLEGMLSAKREVPLPHSMTDRLAIGDHDADVVSSCVRVEIENAAGRVVSVERQVRDAEISTELIAVREGPAITNPGDYERQDYFVRRPGAAQRDAGFHRFLAEFVGWDLPRVTNFDGGESPLYLECLFPYFYVEQKHGWSGVQARMPNYLRIRDVGKRSAEFVMGLEVADQILLRQRLASALANIQAEWRQQVEGMALLATTSGVVLTAGPTGLPASLPEGAYVPQVYESDEWMTVDGAVSRLTAQLQAEQESPIANVETHSEQLESDLARSQAGLDRNAGALSALLDEQDELSQRRNQLALRIEALDEDLNRHRDALLLQNLGSTQSIALMAAHVCPTCHQDLGDGSDVSDHAMSAAQNVEYIRKQRGTFEAMAGDNDRQLAAVDARTRALRQAMASQRVQIRAMKEALSSRSSAPSVAEVTRVVQLRARIEALQLNGRELSTRRQRLTELVQDHSRIREQQAALDRSGLSAADNRKLEAMERLMRAQLRTYQFESLAPGDVDLSRDTYRPVHEGFDLGFDISASDMIRLIWAYLLSLLEVAAGGSGNHAGLLILDEPRQQETARTSYEQLLQYAATTATDQTQLIFATSEAPEELRRMLGHAACNLIDVPVGTRLLRAY